MPLGRLNGCLSCRLLDCHSISLLPLSVCPKVRHRPDDSDGEDHQHDEQKSAFQITQAAFSMIRFMHLASSSGSTHTLSCSCGSVLATMQTASRSLRFHGRCGTLAGM